MRICVESTHTQYKTCRDVLEEEYAAAERERRPHYAMGMVIHGDRRTHDQRRYNSTTTNEIEVVFKSTDGAPPANRRLREPLHSDQQKQRIHQNQINVTRVTRWRIRCFFQTEIMVGIFLCLTRQKQERKGIGYKQRTKRMSTWRKKIRCLGELGLADLHLIGDRKGTDEGTITTEGSVRS